MENTIKEQIRKFGSTYEYKELKQRLATLHKLEVLVKLHEGSLLEALKQDLSRDDSTSKICEIFPIYKEIHFFKRNLKKLMKKKKVKGNIGAIFARNYIEHIPYGVVSIISPWNYPVSLSLIPAIGAIASGNKVVLKPSELSSNVAHALELMFKESEDILVFTGDKEVTKEILDSDIDYVFFTGSTMVGKQIGQKCAERSIPYSLELGGKSPVVLEKGVNMEVACKRIIWGKLLNSGQTCIAPDYVFVRESFKNEFLKTLKATAEETLKKQPKAVNIISEMHRMRLLDIIKHDSKDVIYSHEFENEGTVPFTIINADFESTCMKNEIFGPILPILTYSKRDVVFSMIEKLYPNPLAMYLFTTDPDVVKEYTRKVKSGGMVINDVIMHVNNHALPFGGVGHSGSGNYHGKHSFYTFTHQRSVMKNISGSLFDLRYKINDKSVEKMRKRLTK